MNPIEMGYITVAERLAQFVKDYPNGAIHTQLEYGSDALVVVLAKVWKNKPDSMGVPPDGTGMASMPIPGPTSFTKNSEVENSETSAIGRALAAIGYLAKTEDGKPRISSSDEIAAKSGEDAPTEAGITAKQRGMLMALAKEAGMDPNTPEGKKELQAVTLAATGKHSSKQLTNADVDLLVVALSDSFIHMPADGPD